MRQGVRVYGTGGKGVVCGGAKGGILRAATKNIAVTPGLHLGKKRTLVSSEIGRPEGAGPGLVAHRGVQATARVRYAYPLPSDLSSKVRPQLYPSRLGGSVWNRTTIPGDQTRVSNPAPHHAAYTSFSGRRRNRTPTFYRHRFSGPACVLTQFTFQKRLGR